MAGQVDAAFGAGEPLESISLIAKAGGAAPPAFFMPRKGPGRVANDRVVIQLPALEVARAMVVSPHRKGGIHGTDENSRGSGGTVLTIHSRRDHSPCLCQWRAEICRRWSHGHGDYRRVAAELRLGAAGSQGRRADQGELRDRALADGPWLH